MPKPFILVLAIAAFLYALVVVFLDRRLPDAQGAAGWRRRFLLSAALFAAFLGGPTLIPASEHGASVMAQDDEARHGLADLLDTLSAVWKTLNPKRSGDFEKVARDGADQGLIRRGVAWRLGKAFQEVATHRDRTEGDMRVRCYRMSATGSARMRTRGNVWKQIKALRRAVEDGAVSVETAERVQATLARDLEALLRLDDIGEPGGPADLAAFEKETKAWWFRPSDSTRVTAGLILEMEGVPAPGLDAEKRLAAMKGQLASTFENRPTSNGWMHPGIKPNLLSVLVKAGVLKRVPMMTCYSPPPGPPAAPDPERARELKALQARLLDKSVKAGVLSLETAQKAAQAEQRIDWAREESIRAWQAEMRRVLRLLADHGEFPSNYIRLLERIVDVEIVHFDEEKRIAHDLGFHLRSVLRDAAGQAALPLLESAGVIPPARNHRHVWGIFGSKPTAGASEKALSDLQEYLADDAPLSLPEDADHAVPEAAVSGPHAEWRLKLRRSCRALIKAGFAKAEALKGVEPILELPLLGRVEGR